MPRDLHELPKIRDSVSFLYFEHAVVEQDNSSIVVLQKDGKIPVPVSSLTCLLLGPGISVTSAAIKTITENGCLIIWCGEHSRKFYASGMGETRSASNLLLQAKLCMDESSHLAVVRRMYEIRFPNASTDKLTLQQLRGLEFVRYINQNQNVAMLNGQQEIISIQIGMIQMILIGRYQLQIQFYMLFVKLPLFLLAFLLD